MIKSIYIRALTGLLGNILPLWATGQIPNGSFEEWTSEGRFEVPAGWTVTTEENHSSAQKDTTAFDGQYALRLLPSCSSFEYYGCPGTASFESALNQPLQASHFVAHYICLTTRAVSGHCEIEVNLIKGDEILHTAFWKDSTFWDPEYLPPVRGDYERIELALPAAYLEQTDRIGINLRSVPNRAPDGTGGGAAIFIVDDLSFNTSTSVSSQRPQWKIYPNPTGQYIWIESPGASGRPWSFLLFDLLGQAVVFRQSQSAGRMKISVENIPGGLYVAVIRSNGEGPYSLPLTILNP